MAKRKRTNSNLQDTTQKTLLLNTKRAIIQLQNAYHYKNKLYRYFDEMMTRSALHKTATLS